MVLNADARHTNIQQSVNAYIQATLMTTEGFDVQFPHQAEFAPSGARWLSVDYLPLSVQERTPEVGTGAAGHIERWIVQFQAHEDILAWRQTGYNRYLLLQMLDTVRSYVLPGQQIALRDYTDPGSPVVGQLEVLLTTGPVVIDEGRSTGVATLQLSSTLQWVASYTLS